MNRRETISYYDRPLAENLTTQFAAYGVVTPPESKIREVYGVSVHMKMFVRNIGLSNLPRSIFLTKTPRNHYILQVARQSGRVQFNTSWAFTGAAVVHNMVENVECLWWFEQSRFITDNAFYALRRLNDIATNPSPSMTRSIQKNQSWMLDMDVVKTFIESWSVSVST